MVRFLFFFSAGRVGLVPPWQKRQKKKEKKKKKIDKNIVDQAEIEKHCSLSVLLLRLVLLVLLKLVLLKLLLRCPLVKPHPSVAVASAVIVVVTTAITVA